jgi:HD superfamily phosphohydrolase
MNPTVYNHHVTRISKSMLQRASERLLDSPDINAEQLRRMDDHDLLVALRTNPETTELARRLSDRDLYKRAVWAEMVDVSDDIIDADHDAIREYEDDIAERADVDAEHVTLDVPSRPKMTESSSRVVVNGEIRPLAKQSTLVRALQQVQRDQWRLGVYTPAKETDAVGRAAERVLGLETDGALVSDIRTGVRTTLTDFEEEEE